MQSRTRASSYLETRQLDMSGPQYWCSCWDSNPLYFAGNTQRVQIVNNLFNRCEDHCHDEDMNT